MINKAKRAPTALAAILILSLMSGSEALAKERTLVPMGCTVGIQINTDGVLVVGISVIGAENVSPAGDAGLQPGDVIIRLGRQKITSAEEFLKAAAAQTGDPVSITVRRGSSERQFTVRPLPDADGVCQFGL